jgi:hypothetical protein
VPEDGDPGSGQSPRLSEDLLIERTRLYRTITLIVGIPVGCLSFGVVLLLAVPLAHAIAGRHTDFSFTVTLSFSAVMTLTSGVLGTGLAIQTGRVRHHKSRARELETKIKQQDESEAAAAD